MTEQEVVEQLEEFMGLIPEAAPKLKDNQVLQAALVYSRLVEQWIRLKRGRGR